jgi:hypothetical protein
MKKTILTIFKEEAAIRKKMDKFDHSKIKIKLCAAQCKYNRKCANNYITK